MHLIPIPIPWLILLPFPWESHGTHGIPVFPIPMHTSIPKFVVTKSSRRESHLALGLQKRIWLKFFATACHSNSNQCFNVRDRPISTNKKRLQNFACIKLQGARAPVPHAWRRHWCEAFASFRHIWPSSLDTSYWFRATADNSCIGLIFHIVVVAWHIFM